MRILIVTPHYPPDGGPSAPLFSMLSEALIQRGHEVMVISAVPHYPSGRVPEEFRGRRIKTRVINGVRVIRVPVPSLNRAKLSLRLLQFIWYQVGMTVAGLRQHYDVLLTSNPALQVGLPFAVLTAFRKKPAVFSVHDVYPNAGVDLGVFRHRLTISVISFLERYCFRHAARIRILSESFAPALKEMGVPDKKMELIYDWVDTELITPSPRLNSFAKEHGLLDKFVVLYAGNIGLSQGLETVLTAARLLIAKKDIQFVIVGGGANRDWLVAEVERRQLPNVMLLPFQPRARLPEVLATADVSLVLLRRGIGFRSLPSKSYSILASGRPIIASIDEGSDSWNLIERCHGGICVPPEDPDRLAEAILKMKKNPDLCRELGVNGRAYAEKHHSPQAAALLFENLLKTAIEEDKREKAHGA